MPLHHKERIKEICELMGEDLDAPMCQEVLDHLKTCPTCKVYFDTVKRTIFLCREAECPEELPEDVNNRLLEALNLKDLQQHKELPSRK